LSFFPDEQRTVSYDDPIKSVSLKHTCSQIHNEASS
jgi:hypothetical protein